MSQPLALSGGAVAPPCIVLGLETQIGLNIVRELGRCGVRVIGIAQDPSAIGLRSRFLWRGLVAPQVRSPELLQMIRQLGEEFGPCPLIAIAEVNLLWLARHRQDLGQVQPLLPDPAALATVLDKQATLEAASAVGMAVPWSVQPRSVDDIDAVCARCTEGAVLKWSDPNAVAPRLSAARLPLLKAEYVYSPEGLRQALQRYSELGEWPLVQEYCPGWGLGQFFFMWQGQVLARFQHRRIAEWPPEGGFSAACDAVPLDRFTELQEQSIALLRRVGWTGVAMVEFRHDPRSGVSRLMEINGRYWGSLPLAVHCGVGFAKLAYETATGVPLTNPLPRRDDLRCRVLTVELKRLSRILFQPGKIADRRFAVRPWRELGRFLLDFIRPRVRYFVWSADDPMPLVADVVNAVGRARAG